MKRWPPVACLVALVAACGGKSDRDSEAPPEPSPTSTAEPEPAPSGRCESNADCTVVGPCCGACGTLKAEDAIPLLVADAEAFHASCADPAAPCTQCFRESNPYLVPACEQRMCRVLDLSTVPFSECQTGDDCTLRANECCGDEDSTFVSVSVNALARLDALLCDGAPVRDDCRVQAPMHQGAVCREGRCSSAFFEP